MPRVTLDHLAEGLDPRLTMKRIGFCLAHLEECPKLPWLTLKNAWKRCESVKARGRRARNVLKPPCNTAGPMSSIALKAFLSRLPEAV
jgi:hypothetical protein